MLSNYGAREDSSESLGQQGNQTSQSKRKSSLNVHWKDLYWRWNSNNLATRCKELTHWKRPWCWERLRAGGEGGDRGWDGRMISATQWTWIWARSRSWWRTGKPDVLQSMGSPRVRHKWATEQQQRIRGNVQIWVGLPKADLPMIDPKLCLAVFSPG